MDVWVYSGKDWLVRDPKAPHVAREQWTVKFAPTVVENFEDVLGSAVKIVGVSDDHRPGRALRKGGAGRARRKCVGGSFATLLSRRHAPGRQQRNRRHRRCRKSLAVPPSEIATIGDMPNDVLMFRKSGLSIAMGNASPDVQAQAESGNRFL